MKLGDLYKKLRGDMTAAGLETPEREARLILAHASGVDAATLIAHPDTALSDDQVHAVNNMAARRAAGVPLSRILGWREFYGLRFDLAPETLDPRPETELLVKTALEWLAAHPAATRVLDLGTGTGCIPISILVNAAAVTASAVDISAGAVAAAGGNAALHGVSDRLALYTGDWTAPLPADARFDLVTANPPYIPSGDIAGLDDSVRLHDPIRALDGGGDGYDPYRHLFSAISDILAPGGIALFEIGVGQLADLRRMAVTSGLDAETVVMDYAGTPRVLGVCVPSEK